MSKQEVILCESLETSLGRAIELCPHGQIIRPHRRAYPASLSPLSKGIGAVERCCRNLYRSRRCA